MLNFDFLTNKRSENIPKSEYRYYNLLRVVYLFAAFSHFSFYILFYFINIPELTYVQFLSIVIFIVCINLNKKRLYLLSLIIATFEVVLHQALCVYIIGVDSQYQLLLALCTVLPFLLPKGNNFIKILLLLFSIISFVFIQYVIGNNYLIYSLDLDVLMFIGISNIFITGTLLAIFGLYFSNAVIVTEKELEDERNKSDNLLHNILPLTIANRLKKNNNIIADRFESVSVLFADIVGFTKLSEQLSPKELVLYLNDLFSEFDKIVEKYGLEKIKTMGDSYMVCAGLPVIDKIHAKKIACLALEMLSFMEKRSAVKNDHLQIRIGLHSGPLVAGVIGTKKFSYDVWGDTVNVSSRMESHGESGTIHVSKLFKKSVEEEFEFDKREPINIKGKGIMQTYLLIKRKI